MSKQLNAFAQQHGLSDSTLLGLVETYLSDNGYMEDFLREALQAAEGEAANEVIYNLDNACDEVDEDDDFVLCLCEMAMIDMENDPRTPVETVKVAIAIDADHRFDTLQSLAEQKAAASIPVVAGMVFELTSSDAVEVLEREQMLDEFTREEGRWKANL